MSVDSAVVPTLALVGIVLFSGCMAQLTPPQSVDVASDAESHISNVEFWTSGSASEYKTALVVVGRLDVNNSTGALPEVVGRFNTTGGDSRVVSATYRTDDGRVSYSEFNASERDGNYQFRIVYDPEGKTTVTSARLYLADG